jgi:hypothetical protein
MSDANDSPDDTPEFRSPKRCLARSFRLSRDRWKAKAAERLQQIKALKVKVRDLEVSRELWKAKALHLQAQLAQQLGVVPAPQEDQQGLPGAVNHTDPPAPPDQPAPAAPADAREDEQPKKARRARC